MFIACEEKSIDVDWVLETVRYDRAYISKRTNFIDWSSLVEIASRIASHLSEQEILDLAEASYEYPVNKIWRLMGLLRFDLFGFYTYRPRRRGFGPGFDEYSCSPLPTSEELLRYKKLKKRSSYCKIHW